jgi:signal peptidase II
VKEMKKRVLIISFITLFIDLLTKFLVFSIDKFSDSVVIINNFFKITPVKNFGAAFSTFEHMNILLITISVIILIYLLYMINHVKNTRLNALSYGILIGGLLGNLFDRMVFGYVRDFLSFKIWKFNFAIFNVADMGIVVGIILLMLLSIKKEKE